MGLEIGINLLKDVFMNTSMFGSYWIYQLAFLFGSLAIITRKTSDWGALALPVIVGWHSIGFRFNWLFFAFASLAFVVNAFGYRTLEGVIGSVGNAFKGREGYSLRDRRTEKTLKQYEKIKQKTERLDRLQKWKEGRDKELAYREINQWDEQKKLAGATQRLQNEKYGTKGGLAVLKYADNSEAVTQSNLSKIAKSKYTGKEDRKKRRWIKGVWAEYD